MGAQEDLARQTAYIIRGRSNPTCESGIARKAHRKAFITRKVICHHVPSVKVMVGWCWRKRICWAMNVGLLCPKWGGINGIDMLRRLRPVLSVAESAANSAADGDSNYSTFIRMRNPGSIFCFNLACISFSSICQRICMCHPRTHHLLLTYWMKWICISFSFFCKSLILKPQSITYERMS